MNILYSIGGILIPFIGTSFGSSFVFFMKKNMSENFQKIIVGFASGVMIAASVWSLILPAVEMAEKQGVISWIPATVGLLLGVTFLLLINKMAERFENKSNGKKLNISDTLAKLIEETYGYSSQWVITGAGKKEASPSFSAAKVEFLKKVQKMPDDEITALLAFANSLESVKRTFISEI